MTEKPSEYINAEIAKHGLTVLNAIDAERLDTIEFQEPSRVVREVIHDLLKAGAGGVKYGNTMIRNAMARNDNLQREAADECEMDCQNETLSKDEYAVRLKEAQLKVQRRWIDQGESQKTKGLEGLLRVYHLLKAIESKCIAPALTPTVVNRFSRKFADELRSLTNQYLTDITSAMGATGDLEGHDAEPAQVLLVR